MQMKTLGEEAVRISEERSRWALRKHHSITDVLTSHSFIRAEKEYRRLQLAKAGYYHAPIRRWLEAGKKPGLFPTGNTRLNIHYLRGQLAGNAHEQEAVKAIRLSIGERHFVGVDEDADLRFIAERCVKILQKRWSVLWPHLTPDSRCELIPGVKPKVPDSLPLSLSSLVD